jgi:hypothetical protein
MSRITEKIIYGDDKGAAAERVCVHAKAMESRQFFFFALSVFKEHMNVVPARIRQHLLQAAQGLDQFYSLRFEPRKLSNRACQVAVFSAAKTCSEFQSAGMPLAYKFHFLFEMAKLVPVTGNPFHFSTYPDETVNMTLSQAARFNTQLFYPIRIIQKMEILNASRETAQSKSTHRAKLQKGRSLESS